MKETLTLEVTEKDIDKGVAAIKKGHPHICYCAISQAAMRSGVKDFCYTGSDGRIRVEGATYRPTNERAFQFVRHFDKYANGLRDVKPEPIVLTFTRYIDE